MKKFSKIINQQIGEEPKIIKRLDESDIFKYKMLDLMGRYLKIKTSGKILHDVLEELKKMVKPGVTALELDKFAYNYIRDKGGKPAFLGYKPYGARKGFPNTVCLSINEEVVHGTCYPGKVVEEGDLVSVDCGVNLDGYYRSIPTGYKEGNIHYTIEPYYTPKGGFNLRHTRPLGGDLSSVECNGVEKPYYESYFANAAEFGRDFITSYSDTKGLIIKNMHPIRVFNDAICGTCSGKGHTTNKDISCND
jgi:hypothetical protein